MSPATSSAEPPAAPITVLPMSAATLPTLSPAPPPAKKLPISLMKPPPASLTPPLVEPNRASVAFGMASVTRLNKPELLSVSRFDPKPLLIAEPTSGESTLPSADPNSASDAVGSAFAAPLSTSGAPPDSPPLPPPRRPRFARGSCGSCLARLRREGRSTSDSWHRRSRLRRAA